MFARRAPKLANKNQGVENLGAEIPESCATQASSLAKTPGFAKWGGDFLETFAPGVRKRAETKGFEE